ncbi:MAG: hypothetical protein AAGF12_14120 [Myxococcota bacterium]
MLVVLGAAVAPASSLAQGQAQDEAQETAFEKDLGFGIHAIGWAGDYLAGGVGARIRWEMTSWLGLDLFADQLIVEHPEAFRHDHQVGFNVFVPIALGDTFRIKPLFGFCAVFSFIEPAEEGAPRSDDILYGIHGGIGIEWAFSRYFSFFVDLQAYLYLAHDREAQGWTGSVGEEIVADGVGQLSSGITWHFEL